MALLEGTVAIERDGHILRARRTAAITRVVVGLSGIALILLKPSLLSAALCVASLGLLLTSGRLTRELNHLLRQARHDADNAETLLLAGDIASRVARRGDTAGDEHARRERAGANTEELARAEAQLARLLAGDGLSMVVQPIVDVRTGSVHAYEALARFAGSADSPLHWFEIAATLGERPALERACLRAALDLFGRRPAGVSLSVNLSAPVLLEPLTLEILDERRDLRGLIVEITEEALVQSDTQIQSAIAPLRERGASLAVDDMGAGYSGLRQITSVRPGYLKLDRSLISGIDQDSDRAALVGALVGYSNQVGSLLVAEGIEHSAELRLLGELGVPLAQGYYTGRPGPPWPDVRVACHSARGGSGATLAPAAEQPLTDIPSVDAVSDESLLSV